jgi:7,8-dihydro-6-hydroxymethylpterin dimethyltransferase
MNDLQLHTVIKRTTSKCSVCRKLVPGTVVSVPDGDKEKVVMRRNCPDHGLQSFVIASDSRFYWHSAGHPSNAGCGDGCGCESVSSRGKPATLGRNALEALKHGIIEKLSTCTALIELVDTCNMRCPTCFADSPPGIGGNALKYYSLEDLQTRIRGVIDRKGGIELLQLSGGEPTLHPQFCELVEWARQNEKIDYVLINTNGIRFAQDADFVERMGQLQKRYDNIQIYLQFDGPQLEGQRQLRGCDPRPIRERAIENCGSIGLPITLAMTVIPLNLPFLFETMKYGLRNENIRGVSYQPQTLSGRTPESERGLQPITVADIMLGLEEQSKGEILLSDMTPLPCGDPNCAVIGWRIRLGDKHYSPTEYGIDVRELQSKLPDRINYRIEDLVQCGCENTALGHLMKRMEAKESNAFRIFIKPFMDERTWDEDRIDRCCTHVIRPDGKLDSFCRYYATQPVKFLETSKA